MRKTADWYFDFVSPYSYLQCERLLELFPDEPQLLIQRARLLRAGGRADEAGAQRERGLSLATTAERPLLDLLWELE